MYPVAYEADFAARRSRLTTFFRPLLAIPWLLVGVLWALAAIVCAVIAWFAIVFTGRYPTSLYDVVVAALRYLTRVNGFLLLMTDAWPPFDGREHPEYPVRLRVAPPLPQYDRLKTGFRFILVIPIAIVLYFVQIIARTIAVLAWLVIVVLSRQPRSIFDVTRWALAYESRATAYHLLVTETYPPFEVDDGVAATSAPTPPPATG